MLLMPLRVMQRTLGVFLWVFLTLGMLHTQKSSSVLSVMSKLKSSDGSRGFWGVERWGKG